MFTEEVRAQLGLPYDLAKPRSEEQATWSAKEKEAESRILAEFPILDSPPPDYFVKTPSKTSYRLYRHMAPLDNFAQSIVFLGHIAVPNAFRPAECQALWATAYLDWQIRLPSADTARAEIAYVNAWNRRRYINNGSLGNYLHYDMIGYTDRLLEDLHLESRQKGWWRDMMEPCWSSDILQPRKAYLQRVKEQATDSRKKD